MADRAAPAAGFSTDCAPGHFGGALAAILLLIG
jgi:hypothetical protein